VSLAGFLPGLALYFSRPLNFRWCPLSLWCRRIFRSSWLFFLSLVPSSTSVASIPPLCVSSQRVPRFYLTLWRRLRTIMPELFFLPRGPPFFFTRPAPFFPEFSFCLGPPPVTRGFWLVPRSRLLLIFFFYSRSPPPPIRSFSIRSLAPRGSFYRFSARSRPPCLGCCFERPPSLGVFFNTTLFFDPFHLPFPFVLHR